MSSRTKVTVADIESARQSISASSCVDFLKLIVKYNSEVTAASELSSSFLHSYKQTAAFTRIAASLTDFICAADTKLSKVEFQYVCAKKSVFVDILTASGFVGTSHLAERIMRPKGENSVDLKSQKVLMLLAFQSIDEIHPAIINLLASQHPDVILPASLGLLSQRAVLTRQGEENRTQIIDIISNIRDIDIPDVLLPAAFKVWMYCSYAVSTKKHDVKSALNHLFRRKLNTAGVKALVAEKSPTPRSKPLCVVPLERYRSGHAMHRCYSAEIANLKSRFEVIAVASSKEVDQNSKTDFSSCIEFDSSSTSVEALAAQIASLSPDVIYFPSIGMSYWTILLANMRLAPLQVATLGHPATTRSEFIDEVFVNSVVGDVSSFFSEDVFVNESALFPILAHAALTIPPRRPSSNGSADRLKVAINCKVMKLNYQIIDVCKELSSSLEKKLDFHFFPGEKACGEMALCNRFEQVLPGSTVHSPMSYPALLSELCTCDFGLTTFPFGNANGVVDCALAGVPAIFLRGTEPMSQSDIITLKSLNCPMDCAANSVEDYFKKAQRLATDDGYRAKLSNELIVRSNGYFFGTSASTIFSGQLLEWIWGRYWRDEVASGRADRPVGQ